MRDDARTQEQAFARLFVNNQIEVTLTINLL